MDATYQNSSNATVLPLTTQSCVPHSRSVVAEMAKAHWTAVEMAEFGGVMNLLIDLDGDIEFHAT